MNKLILLTIFSLAILLRFFQLGQNPPSLDWDEASLGYNAYSILKTGADEYGNKFPISIRSFDDYKPPLYAYLTIPSIILFGLNEFSTRFTSAFFGSLTVILMYFLIKELFTKYLTHVSLKSEIISVLGAFLLAISPWHLQFSRAAFEANLGLFFFSLGVFLLLKGIKIKSLIISSLLSFSLSIYAYHSFRLIVPLFLVGIFFLFKTEIIRIKKYVLIGMILMGVLLFPIALSFVNNSGGTSRFSSVTILKPTGTLDHSIQQLEYDRETGNLLGEIFHNRRVVYFLTVTKNYFDHWNIDFLFLRGDGVERHHAEGVGMLYLFELPFVLIGIYYLIKLGSKSGYLIFLWIFIAPAAASITTGTPHPVRAIAMVIPLHILTAFGLYNFFLFIQSKLEKTRWQLKSLITIIAVAATLNIIYYLHQYYIHTPLEYSKSWQYGYKQVIEEVSKYETKYDKIIITYKYDQPYIYYLFYNKVDPAWYQANWNFKGDGTIERDRRIIAKYEFRNIKWGEDQSLTNTLIVGTPDEIPPDVPSIKDIKFLDGNIAFRIVGR